MPTKTEIHRISHDIYVSQSVIINTFSFTDYKLSKKGLMEKKKLLKYLWFWTANSINENKVTVKLLLSLSATLNQCSQDKVLRILSP